MPDPIQAQRIRELKKELIDHGFDRPVVLERDHWWSLRPRVSDGVHRSIAAMELGMPIPVQCGYSDDNDYDHGDVYTVTLADPSPIIEDLLDAVVSLSSFRSSAGPWIQCDVASGKAGGPVSLYLPRHPELRQLIASELQERLRAAGIDSAVAFLENRSNEE